jgi:hypothetical protein
MAKSKAQRQREAAQKARNRQGFIDAYNKGNPTRPYGSAGFKADVKAHGSLGQGRKVTLGRPPPGSYDPDIDAQERAAQRGYGNTIEDLGRARERASTDFGLGETEISRQYGENLSDLIKQRTEGTADYHTNLQSIARNFSQLGNVQAQRGRQAGLGGGFAAQAQRKRAANEAITRAPVDLGFQRFMEGSQLAERRLGEAKQRETGQLGLGQIRGSEDLSVTGERAGTELNAYIQDAAAARQAQYGGPLATAMVGQSKKPWGPKPSAATAFARSQARGRAGANRATARARARARKRGT